MYRIVKACYIDMAHRIRGHEGKCRFLHGHTCRIDVSVSCETLNALGMVVDFGWLKERILHQIEKGFDHTLVLGQPDRDGINKIADLDPTSGCGKCVKVLGEALGLLTPLGSVMELGVVTLHNMSNPTAENLAKWCFDRADFEIQPLEVGEKRGLKVDYIRVYEQLHPTESYAEYFK